MKNKLARAMQGWAAEKADAFKPCCLVLIPDVNHYLTAQDRG